MKKKGFPYLPKAQVGLALQKTPRKRLDVNIVIENPVNTTAEKTPVEVPVKQTNISTQKSVPSNPVLKTAVKKEAASAIPDYSNWIGPAGFSANSNIQVPLNAAGINSSYRPFLEKEVLNFLQLSPVSTLTKADTLYWNTADLEKEILSRQQKDNKYYGEFDKKGDDILNRTDIGRNKDSEIFLANYVKPNSVIIDIGSALGNNNPTLAGVSVYELTQNPKLKQKGTRIIATDIPSEVKGFENLKKKYKTYPIDYAEVPLSFNTPVANILKSKNLQNVNNVYLRAANSIDLLMNTEETKEHFKHISNDLYNKNVTYLFNNIILYKPANSKTFKKIGNLADAAFDHRSNSWKNKSGASYNIVDNNFKEGGYFMGNNIIKKKYGGYLPKAKTGGQCPEGYVPVVGNDGELKGCMPVRQRSVFKRDGEIIGDREGMRSADYFAHKIIDRFYPDSQNKKQLHYQIMGSFSNPTGNRSDKEIYDFAIDDKNLYDASDALGNEEKEKELVDLYYKYKQIEDKTQARRFLIDNGASKVLAGKFIEDTKGDLKDVDDLITTLKQVKLIENDQLMSLVNPDRARDTIKYIEDIANRFGTKIGDPEFNAKKFSSLHRNNLKPLRVNELFYKNEDTEEGQNNEIYASKEDINYVYGPEGTPDRVKYDPEVRRPKRPTSFTGITGQVPQWNQRGTETEFDIYDVFPTGASSVGGGGSGSAMDERNPTRKDTREAKRLTELDNKNVPVNNITTPTPQPVIPPTTPKGQVEFMQQQAQQMPVSYERSSRTEFLPIQSGLPGIIDPELVYSTIPSPIIEDDDFNYTYESIVDNPFSPNFPKRLPGYLSGLGRFIGLPSQNNTDFNIIESIPVTQIGIPSSLVYDPKKAKDINDVINKLAKEDAEYRRNQREADEVILPTEESTSWRVNEEAPTSNADMYASEISKDWETVVPEFRVKTKPKVDTSPVIVDITSNPNYDWGYAMNNKGNIEYKTESPNFIERNAPVYKKGGYLPKALFGNMFKKNKQPYGPAAFTDQFFQWQDNSQTAKNAQRQPQANPMFMSGQNAPMTSTVDNIQGTGTELILNLNKPSNTNTKVEEDPLSWYEQDEAFDPLKVNFDKNTKSEPSFGQKVGAFAKGMWKGANADNILLGTKALNNLLEKTPDYDQFQRNYKEPGQSMSRGDWTTNQGFLQPNRLGYFDKFSVGTGSMQFGGEVDMTDDEIYEFLAAGGELEFID